MSKSLSKYTGPGEIKSIINKQRVIAKNFRLVSKHKEVNTTGLSYPFSAKSNVEIDKQIEGPCGNLPTEELNGILVTDPTNSQVFMRQNGEWKRLKIE